MIRRWFPPIVSVCFVMAGSFKAASLFDRFPIDLTLFFALCTGGAVAWFLLSKRALPRPAVSILIGFVILLPPVLWAPSIPYARTKIVDMFTLALLAGLAPAVMIENRKDVERWIWVWVAVSAALPAGSFLEPVQQFKGAPISSFANNTITLGLTASTVLVVMSLALLWRRVPPWIALPVMGAMIIALLNSGSRGPLFGAVLALAFATVLAPGRVRLLPAIAGAVSVMAAIIYAYRFAPVYAQARIADLLSGKLDSSSSARVALAHAAIPSIAAHPLGLGWGGFVTISPYPELVYPHNIVLEVLCEGGVFIGAAFLTWLAIQLFRSWQGSMGFTGSTVFALVVLNTFIALVSGDLHDEPNFFFVLGISAAYFGLTSSAGSRETGDEPRGLSPGSDDVVGHGVAARVQTEGVGIGERFDPLDA